MPKVLISDKLAPDAVEIFKDRGVDVDFRPGLSAEELLDIIADYDGLAIRSATKVTEEVLAKATKLRAVGRAGIGVDNVDVVAATNAGVIVMNTPYGNSVTTAEHAISMMLSLTRQIPQAHASTIAGKWEKSKFLGTELSGKRLGIIGCGNIGAIVADRAQGLKMRVMGFDPFLSPERAKTLGIEKVELDELLEKADFISLHTPLTDATRNVISADALQKTKKGVRIINCARGGLIDEVALCAALHSGHVAGAALDVFAEEPARENILFEAPNLIATPHLGASTVEAQEKVALQVAEQLSDYLMNGAVTNALNMANVSAEEAPILQPYMKLGSLLGSFLGQVATPDIQSVRLEFDGKASQLNEAPVLASTLSGFLGPKMDSVNMVNAAAMASSRGIDVSTVRHDRRCDYESLLRMTISFEGGERTVAGTLVGGNKPRLVEVQNIGVEAEFANNMLYIRNYDKPGFIGALGSVFGDLSLNVASFHLGRKNEGEEAIALVEVDGAISDEALDTVKKIPQIVRADRMHFSA